MLGIQCLNPSDESFLNLVNVSGFIDVYGGDMEDLTHEVYQVKKLLQRTKPVPDLETMLELAIFLDPYQLAFHELYRLVHIALVLPVSTASCERSFSAMKLIKSYLRSTMCDGRLSSIAILSIESARAEAIDLNKFIEEFDLRHGNRKLALH